MTQNYELIVKGIRNFENKVTVTLASFIKNALTKFFDLDISLDRVEGAALGFHEAAARRRPDRSPRMLLPGYVKWMSKVAGKAPRNFRGRMDNLQRKATRRITGSLKTPPNHNLKSLTGTDKPVRGQKTDKS